MAAGGAPSPIKPRSSIPFATQLTRIHQLNHHRLYHALAHHIRCTRVVHRHPHQHTYPHPTDAGRRDGRASMLPLRLARLPFPDVPLQAPMNIPLALVRLLAFHARCHADAVPSIIAFDSTDVLQRCMNTPARVRRHPHVEQKERGRRPGVTTRARLHACNIICMIASAIRIRR